jgi:archaetidylinositol phosphate synthase
MEVIDAITNLNAAKADGREDRLVFKNARRKQESIVAPIERACLNYFAARVPARIGPDHLTMLGLAAQFLAGVCYGFAGRWPGALLLANVFIALNWFGDSLDGTLARFRNQQRPRFGFYVDHMADTFGAIFLIAGLAASGYVSERIATGMLVAFLLLSVNAYLATYTIGTFQLSYFKLSPTEVRLLLVIANVAAFYRPTVHLLGRPHLLFDVGGAAGTAAMIALVVFSSIRNTMKLYRMERI